MSAEAGSILKVIGTRIASAMVAVSPGMDPMIVPATTPNNANAMLKGVIADKKCTQRCFQSKNIALIEFIKNPTGKATTFNMTDMQFDDIF